jgi:precorrin-6B methylase 2
MKKIKLNATKLQLNKEKISNLTNQELGSVQGGALWTFGGCTGGCSDGCEIILMHTKWNCTKTNCTNDCPTFETTSGTCPR